MASRSHLHVRRDTGRVERQGVEQPPATVAAETDEVIVLKVPGHGYWVGRGMPDAYAPAEYQVWRWEQLDHEPGTDGWATLLVAYPVRATK